ncbi:MAG: GNAT family N-acetyltransferase [Dehalococcoidia bacterium]|nr:GNAT family N-acetyltransferase [Dehalococcoidia bacterium]
MVDELRPISEDEHDEWNQVPFAGFSNVPEPGELAGWCARTEFDRTLVAIEDGQMVGTTAVNTYSMHVPGGAMVPTAGVTAVSVLPTHRRRGVLSSMMRRQLDDVRARGEVLAALWASETVIYGRFGYGMAIPQETWQIERVRADLAKPAPEEGAGRVRFVDRAQALERFPELYQRVVGSTSGMLQPADGWWNAQYGEGGWSEENQKEEPFRVVFERDGEVEGFASYKVGGFESARSIRELSVKSLYATTTEAHEGLWRFIFGVDLIEKVVAAHRPIDDALPWMLQDMRRLERDVFDAIWLRLVDVPAALAARTYSAAGRLVLGVRDEFCPWNDGRYALGADEDGTTSCATSDDAPELELGADALAAAYLGGVSFSTLARAGRVQEQVAGAVAKADAMFRTERAPWTALDF